MNVFEDLVVELKEENLLEETFIERPPFDENGDSRNSDDTVSSFQIARPGSNETSESTELALDSTERSETIRPAVSTETVRRRLAEQMRALELVELVISAVERIHGRSGQPFDDLSLKKSFHRFDQACSDSESDEYFEAESALRSSLEAWQKDLVARDENIPIPAIRKYAESANPPLSPQALFALVRFYRSLPASDVVCAKFDFVVTRLFSKFVDGERREMLCPRSDVVHHLKKRYSLWTSDNRSLATVDDAELTSLVLSLDDFIAEVEAASKLDELSSSKFFDRLYELKRSSGDMMFIPRVVAAAVELNLRASRKVIDLMAAEKERHGVASRFSGADSSLISNALARTFVIGPTTNTEDVKFNNEPGRQLESVRERTLQLPIAARQARIKHKSGGGGSSLFGINRWLLLVTVLTLVASSGIYVWSEYFAGETVSSSGVKVVDLGSPEIRQYVKTSKMSGSMLYALVTTEFEKLNSEQQRDLLQKMRQAGEREGFTQITVVNSQGKNIAFASVDRIDIPRN